MTSLPVPAAPPPGPPAPLPGSSAAPQPSPSAPLVLAVTNQKGGTAKTTTAVHLAAAYARRGLSTLLLDTDPQGHSATSLGITGAGSAMSRLARGEATVADVAVKARERLMLVASSRTLVSAERDIAADPAGLFWLARHRAAMGAMGVSVVVVDCPPGLGSLSVGAYVLVAEWIAAGARGGLVVPVVLEPLAVVGVADLVQSVAPLRERGLAPDLVALVPSSVDTRRLLSREVLAGLDGAFPERVSPPVRMSVRVPEASGSGMTVFETDPDGRAAHDIEAVADFLITHC